MGCCIAGYHRAFVVSKEFADSVCVELVNDFTKDIFILVVHNFNLCLQMFHELVDNLVLHDAVVGPDTGLSAIHEGIHRNFGRREFDVGRGINYTRTLSA